MQEWIEPNPGPVSWPTIRAIFEKKIGADSTEIVKAALNTFQTELVKKYLYGNKGLYYFH